MSRPHIALVLAAWIWVCALGGTTGAQAPARSAAAKATQTLPPARFGIGREATPAEIAALDIDIMPDGTGLPPGRGTPPECAAIFASRCAGCHCKTGKERPNDVLLEP